MALRTIQAGMRSRQGKAGDLGMIKVFVESIHAVTGRALRRKSCRFVIHSLRTIIVADVTGSAVRAESAEHSNGGAFVAAFAFYSRMGANQGKAVGVTIDILGDLPPSASTMALLAVAPKLAAMNVRVAIGALGSDICKNKLPMALPAIHPLVHSHEGKSRCTMIEIWKWADRLESC